eukprot:CAMPEP_0114273710 /NCGR_PEP_ID=MMETSP0058-20121206/29282_1 /TAXON_ID=36894 /ORGANISM="Pyramimonas parkeae, CCMP726" /LENGTH=239 /DNA_ID=CAMNT_0001393263 /DNA_START=112 /DNA_END=832 /DNA_ORIENTATION=-
MHVVSLPSFRLCAQPARGGGGVVVASPKRIQRARMARQVQGGKAHDEHDPVSRGGCCSGFSSSYLCVVCECHQEQHETVFESELERAQAGRPVGKEFMPLADMPETQRLVLGGKKAALPVGTLEDQLNSGAITTQQYYQMIQSSDQDAAAASAQGAHSSLKERALRPPNALDTHGQVEKSVRIMHENCGGRSTGTALNAYGLTEDNLIAHGASSVAKESTRHCELTRWVTHRHHIAGRY